MAGAEGCCWAREEIHGAYDVARCAEATKGCAPGDPRPLLRRQRSGKIGLQEARSDRIHADATGAQLTGEAAGEALQSGLCGGVDGEARRAAFDHDG